MRNNEEHKALCALEPAIRPAFRPLPHFTPSGCSTLVVDSHPFGCSLQTHFLGNTLVPHGVGGAFFCLPF